MPRGKPRSIDERIMEIKEKIEKTEQVIRDLKAQRKELDAQKHTDIISTVMEIATQNGLSVEELLEKAVNAK